MKATFHRKVPKFGIKDTIKMQMKNLKNATYIGSSNRMSLIDLKVPKNFKNELIVFIHGYMGFKDWGAWNLMEDYFVKHGFGFCKLNLTHNGGTTENGIDFPDLEAFSMNSYTKEVRDIHFALDWLETQFEHLPTIHLMGHSRGGGDVLLAGSDKRVSSIITLAAISSVTKRFADESMIESWRKDQIRYTINQRTKQRMPHDFSQYEDFVNHQEQLDIEKAVKKLKKPLLLIHGENDVSVSISEGEELATWANVTLHRIPNTDHVFGSSHPWKSSELPAPLQYVCELILAFLEQK